MTNDNETALAVLDGSTTMSMQISKDAISALKDMKAGHNITGNVHNFSAGESIRGYVFGIKQIPDKNDETKTVPAISFVTESPDENGEPLTVILADIMVRNNLYEVAMEVQNCLNKNVPPPIHAYEISCKEEGVKGANGKYKKFDIRLLCM